MKEIKLRKSARIAIGTDPININDAVETHRLVLRNTQEILSAALVLEKKLEHAIAFFLFGPAAEKRAFFEAVVLTSDWCSFSAKRKVTMAILNESKILDGEEKANFERLMSKIMKYRNAFAHGEVTQSAGSVSLAFFDGQRQVRELNDGYWTQLENDFSLALVQVDSLLKKMGAVGIAEQSVPVDRREDAGPAER